MLERLSRHRFDMRLVALITCHNRRQKTLACLQAYFSSQLPSDCRFDAILVDDGCTDGTTEEVSHRWPDRVHILAGSGNLYWAGGMRVAFAAAMEQTFDFCLFLNDDTLVYPDTIARLIECYRMVTVDGSLGAVIVGTTRDPVTGAVSYGGLRQTSRLRPLKLDVVPPSDAPQRCDSMNANCVLVPRLVAGKIGNLDAGFRHRIADVDYGLRVTAAGYTNWVVPGFAGDCEHDHPISGSWLDAKTPFRERIRQIQGPKGLPWREWLRFSRRHAGPLWPIFWVWPYLKVIFTSALRRFA
jgi:GT2 family glycosyltransferase